MALLEILERDDREAGQRPLVREVVAVHGERDDLVRAVVVEIELDDLGEAAGAEDDDLGGYGETPFGCRAENGAT
jgi:hypothetical protein